jgi:rod shape-determining protein MreD
LAIAAIVQSVVLPRLAIMGVKADLVLLLVIAWSIRRGVGAGIVWAIIGGIAIDLLSVEPLGLSVVAMGIIATLAGSFGPALRRTSALLPLAITPPLSILATLIGAAALALDGWAVFWPVTVALVVLPSAVVNSVAMLAVYPLVSAIDGRFGATEWPT